MKTIHSGIAELGSVMCELYTLTMLDGDVHYFNTSDQNLTYNGHLYRCDVLAISRGAVKSSVGIEVDTTDVTLSGLGQISGLTAPAFARNGGFDGARLTIHRARADRVIHLFEGSVSDVQVGRYNVTLSVSSDMELLNVQMPRNLYSAGCGHILYDTGCGLTRSAWGVSSAVLADSTANVILCGLVQADDYFSLGVIEFTTGANVGSKHTIKKYSTGNLGLSYPLDFTPTIGDTFTVFPGCNKALATCKTKFTNSANFRAFPFVPVPEESI